MTTTIAPHRLHDRLSRETRAEVHFDRGTRGLYATDASLYQIEPLGVVVPRTADDVVAAVRIAAEERVPIAAARGGHEPVGADDRPGRSCIDFSKYLNRIGIVDRDSDDRPGRAGRRARPAQRPPQAARADVRARRLHQRPRHDRRHDRQQLGRRPVAAVWQDGRSRSRASTSCWPTAPPRRSGRLPRTSWTRLCPGDDLGGHDPSRRSATRWRGIARRSRRGFRTSSAGSAATTSTSSSPGLPVRPVGWRDEPWQFNLARLIVGSEGTLAVVTAAELKVVPLPPAQGLVVLSFATIPAALDRLAEIVATGPVAVEMLDRMILDLAARTRCIADHLNFAAGPPRRRPGRPVLRRLAGRAWPPAPPTSCGGSRAGRGVLGVRKSLTAADKDDFWKVRKAGFSLLDGHGRRRQADRLRRGHGRRARPAARVLRAVRGDRRHGTGCAPPAMAMPTSAACTSGRSST